MDKIFIAVIIAVLVYSIGCVDSSVCVQKSSCLCEFSEHSKIDISKATQEEKPLKPEDFLHDELNGVIYYFHGCTDGVFNLSAHGINVNNTDAILKGSLIAQSNAKVGGNSSQTISNATVVGSSSQIKFNPIKGDETAYEIVYKDATGNISASIRLLCDNFNQPFIKALPNTSNEQILVLSSPHACIVTQHPGLSTGSVLVILFFISVAIYFVGGAAILYFIRGARGLELIPNIDFWRELPGLVKDGIIFLFSGCRAQSVNTPESYDRI